MSGWRSALFVPVVVSTALACGTGSSVDGTSQPRPSVTQPGETISPSAPASPSATVSPASPSAAPSAPRQTDRLLRFGDRGPAVLRLQQKLVGLGYWLGKPDAVFGGETEQAVYALQHAAGISVDGVVGRATLAALARRTQPSARTSAGDALEIDVPHQLLLVVVGGRVQWVLHVSTGGEYVYVDRGGTYRATTPRGRFHIERMVDGWDHSTLGWLWRPAYFVGGYALHGYLEVPPYPASHGCVRVGMAAMNWLWDSGIAKVGQPMWVY
ncbi:MAG TPA: L,D-transpeptidase family protein [Mycobacteriales bacterium]|nr:L,D-transpeptidase family protein [Mycobacteriales bacterium]